MVLNVEIAARIGDFRKLFHLLRKASRAREIASEMIQNNDRNLVNTINGRMRWR